MKFLHMYYSSIRHYVLMLLVLCSVPAFTQTLPLVGLRVVADSITSPMHLTHAGDGSNRIFIAERQGIVRVYSSTFEPLDKYLDISSLVNTTGEGGLLSIAFHPNFETNGYFFVHYTDANGDLNIRRYTATSPESNTIPTQTAVNVLTITHNRENHFGGEMHFGKDNYLYISTGDGGGSYDPDRNAQDPTKLLGKILRIDVSLATAPYYTVPADNPYPFNTTLPRSPVYAIGLRNPFRWSFDRQTGDMWIGDVGQSSQEEVNFIPANQIRGANLGWICYEGSGRTPTIPDSECTGQGNLAPYYSYPTTSTDKSVVGGVVYRGTTYPNLVGTYVGSEFFSGNFHVFTPGMAADDRGMANVANLKANISDFGEDENGEIYALSLFEGKVYQVIDNSPLPATLVRFTGQRMNEGTALAWETTAETSFNRFEIEYGLDGKVFTNVGTIQASNQATGSAYQFYHLSSGLMNAYYRLKMLDNDNSFEYSRIISVGATEQTAQSFVRPSIIEKDYIQVVLEDAYQSLEVVTESGVVMHTQNISGKQGPLSVPISHMSSGIYIVRLSGEAKVARQKILVAR